jgi:hypothetical protein
MFSKRELSGTVFNRHSAGSQRIFCYLFRGCFSPAASDFGYPVAVFSLATAGLVFPLCFFPAFCLAALNGCDQLDQYFLAHLTWRASWVRSSSYRLGSFACRSPLCQVIASVNLDPAPDLSQPDPESHRPGEQVPPRDGRLGSVPNRRAGPSKRWYADQAAP